MIMITEYFIRIKWKREKEHIFHLDFSEPTLRVMNIYIYDRVRDWQTARRDNQDEAIVLIF